MKKMDFSFFVTYFSPKNEKFAKNDFRFSVETIVEEFKKAVRQTRIFRPPKKLVPMFF